MITASGAFTRAISGSLNEHSAAAYNQRMQEHYAEFEGLGGWLGETLENAKQNHEKFMTSRLWEFSNLFDGKKGMYVGKYEIGFLSKAEYQRDAIGLMRNYIMANPNVMEMYNDDRIYGYGGDFSDLCSGIGRENHFFNKAMSGVLYYNEDKELVRTDYTTSIDGFGTLTRQERQDIQRTWLHSNQHIAENLLDFTDNLTHGSIKTVEEAEAIRKEREEARLKED